MSTQRERAEEKRKEKLKAVEEQVAEGLADDPSDDAGGAGEVPQARAPAAAQAQAVLRQREPARRGDGPAGVELRLAAERLARVVALALGAQGHLLGTCCPSRVKKRTVKERPTLAPLRMSLPLRAVIELPLTSAAPV